VVDAARDARFLNEARDDAAVDRVLSGENFDRCAALEVYVSRVVHPTHSASADDGFEAVAAQHFAELSWLRFGQRS
jgi:hypothetical protein